MIAIFNQLEFRSLIKELPQSEAKGEVGIGSTEAGQMSLFGEAEAR